MLFAVSTLIYVNILSYDLTGCDDKLLLDNAASVIRGQQSAPGFINSPYLFNDGLFYRPIVNASVLLTSLASGSVLYLHYALNILIHFLSTLLLYLVLLKLKNTPFQSLMLTLIFAVNPLFVNSVAWLPGRNDSFLALFILFSFYSLLKYSEKGKPVFLVLHGFGFLAALFSKETAVAAVIVFPVYLILFHKDFFRSKLFLLFPVWFVPLLLWYLIRRSVIHNDATYDLLRNTPHLVQSIGKVMLPVNLTVLPLIENTTFLYGLFSLVVLAILYWYSDRTNNTIKLMSFGFFWFTAFLLPGLLNINPEYSQDIMLECRLYLPAVGVFFFISQTEFVKKLDISNKYLIGFYLLIIGVFVYSNIDYSRNYRNDFSFWQDASVNSPSLDLAQAGMGLYYLRNEKYERAIEYYNKAIDLNGRNIDYYRKAAFCLTRLNRTEEAALYYEKVLAAEPGDFDANLVLGIINFKKSDYLKAESLLLRAESIKGNDLQPKIYLMRIYRAKGDSLRSQNYENILKAKGYTEPVK